MKMSSEPSSISSNEALLDDISLGDMRFLCALIESRSLTEAAKATASNLSSASRRLKRLRKLLGDPLFLRSTPNMIPTARVLALEPVIRSIIRSSADLLEPEVFSPATLKRTFRIGAVDNAIFAVMLGVLEKLCESAPGVSVEIRQIEDDLFDELASGAIDLAVLPATRPILPSFREKLLYPVTYSLCVRKGHPLEKYWLEHGELPIEEISRYRKIVVSNRSLKERQQFVLDESRFLGRSVQDAAFSVPYFLAVPALLERTNFTAILPKDTALALTTYLREPLTVLPYGPNGQEATLYYTRIIWHERTDRDPALVWLRGLFATYAGCDVSDSADTTQEPSAVNRKSSMPEKLSAGLLSDRPFKPARSR